LLSFFTKKNGGHNNARFCTQKQKKKKKTHTSLKPQTLISTSIWNAIFRVSYEKDWRKVSSLKAQKSSRDANLLSSGISSKKREIELVLSFEEEGLKKSI
jgi:hypothetical protein